MTQQKHEGGFLVSYDTCHKKGEIEAPLDINNTKIYIPMTNNSPPWDEG